MFPSRLMTLWVGLVLVFVISVIAPDYGTGGEQAASLSDHEIKSDQHVEAKASTAMATPDMASTESHEAEATSPELKLVEKLQARLQQLDQREQQIQDDEQRLGALRRDLEGLASRQEKAIAEAMAIRESQKVSNKIDESQESLNHLIKVYEAMDPEEAALRISKMDEMLALDILAGIKDKKAAGMLAGIEPSKAAKLTKGLRYYHQRKDKATP